MCDFGQASRGGLFEVFDLPEKVDPFSSRDVSEPWRRRAFFTLVVSHVIVGIFSCLAISQFAGEHKGKILPLAGLGSGGGDMYVFLCVVFVLCQEIRNDQVGTKHSPTAPARVCVCFSSLSGQSKPVNVAAARGGWESGHDWAHMILVIFGHLALMLCDLLVNDPSNFPQRFTKSYREAVSGVRGSEH